MEDQKDLEMNEGDEVEVTFSDDEKTAPTVEKTSTAKEPESPAGEGSDEEEDIAGYSASVKKRLGKLTFKAREAERQLNEAVKIAASYKEENDKLKKGRVQSDKHLAGEYEHRLKLQRTRTNELLRAAIENGDSEKQAEFQADLARLAVEDEKVRVAKQNIENWEKANPAGEEPERRAPAQPQVPEVKPDPKAQAWAEKNEWFGTDANMTKAAFVFHDSLAEEGFELGSDDYYKELNGRMRAAYPSRFKREITEERQERTATQTVAGGRPTDAGRPASKNKVKLTQSQVAIARRLGVSLEDYASQLRKLNS
jgi:hypothetical protein